MAIVAMGSTAAFAQDGEDEDAVEESSSANEIIVTATLREQTLEEVPLAVSVVGGDYLDQTGVGGVESLQEAVPSLTFTKGNNELNSSLNIRGIGTSVFSSGVEPAVSTVIDGVVMGRAGQGFQDLIDVQRVEVIRGPQSTLFGKNATAGVLSIITQDPTDYFSGKVDASYAEGNEYSVRGTVSGPIADNLGVRVSAFHRNYDGFTRNVFNGDKYNGYETYGGRAKLKWESSGTSFTLIGDYRNYEGSPTFVVAGGGSPAFNAAIAPVVPSFSNTEVNVNTPAISTSKQWGVSLNGEIELGDDFQLTTISAYRKWDFLNNLDVDQLPFADPQPGGLLTFDLNEGRTNLKQYSQEIRLASRDLGGFDFLVGALYYRLELDRAFRRRLEIALPAFQLNQSGQFAGGVSTTNLAAFASANVYLGDFTIFGGLRLIHEKIDFFGFRDPTNVVVPGDFPFGGALGNPADFNKSASDTELVGRIGARYELGDLGNIYASYSRGYKGQGVNVAFASQNSTEPVPPEIVDAFEVGLKMRTLDDVLSLNIAAFHTKYDGYQAQAQRPGEITFDLTSAGTVSTQGIELESVIQPNELLTIRLGVTYADAKIDTFPGGPCYPGQTAAQGCVNGAQDLAGATLPNAPDFRVTGFVKQVVPFGDATSFNGFVQANGTLKSDEQFGLNQDPRTIQDGYGRLNLAVGLEDKDNAWSISAFVRNVFDENSPAALGYFTLFGGINTAQVSRDQERYFGVQGSYSF